MSKTDVAASLAQPIGVQVVLSTPCQLVTAKQVLAGNVSLTANHLLFCGGEPAGEGPPSPTRSKVTHYCHVIKQNLLSALQNNVLIKA
jgi:hypothetical protein